MTKENQIKCILVEHGKALFNAPVEKVSFAQNPDADLLINNIEQYPHTFVLGCIADRQVKAEVAWRVPYHLANKLGTFKFERLLSLSEEKLKELMKDSGHRLWITMSNLYYLAIKRINDDYVDERLDPSSPHGSLG